jgi:hypothetical protein
MRGVLEVVLGSWLIPSFSITRRERTFAGHGERDDLLQPGLSSAQPNRSASRAPRSRTPGSRRRPRAASRFSTQGVKCASNRGRARPTQPTNGATPGTSTAHQPKPCFLPVLPEAGQLRRRLLQAQAAPGNAPSPGDPRSARRGEPGPRRGSPGGGDAPCGARDRAHTKPGGCCSVIPRRPLQRQPGGAEGSLVPEMADERHAGGHLPGRRHRRVLLAGRGEPVAPDCGPTSTNPPEGTRHRLTVELVHAGSSRSAARRRPLGPRGRQYEIDLRELLGPDSGRDAPSRSPGRSPPRKRSEPRGRGSARRPAPASRS